MNAGVEAGFVGLARNLGHGRVAYFATEVVPGRGPEATRHGVRSSVGGKGDGVIGRAEGEVRLVSSILDLVNLPKLKVKLSKGLDVFSWSV